MAQTNESNNFQVEIFDFIQGLTRRLDSLIKKFGYGVDLDAVINNEDLTIHIKIKSGSSFFSDCITISKEPEDFNCSESLEDLEKIVEKANYLLNN